MKSHLADVATMQIRCQGDMVILKLTESYVSLHCKVGNGFLTILQ